MYKWSAIESGCNPRIPHNTSATPIQSIHVGPDSVGDDDEADCHSGDDQVIFIPIVSYAIFLLTNLFHSSWNSALDWTCGDSLCGIKVPNCIVVITNHLPSESR